MDFNKLKNSTAVTEIEKRYEDAKKILKDDQKVESFLKDLEKKLNKIPVAGNTLATIPVMASLVNNYAKKKYTNIPTGVIVLVVSALIYFVTPFDIVPDSIPFLGFLDDAFILSQGWKMAQSDLEKYQKWRKEQNKDKIVDIEEENA
ncbi:YkvA family protein [Streptococcus sp. CSL10205-OR2]|uniref:YkvA family protein n=1 Tax=Streptococcus sp. CSL10205-OR2 TaxID=2980558 RepID=UPI0021DA57E0|nr:YkvA family protein [Streptococcus sp. CSL10205-OR2]MCU9533252.1 YkvA family protein [Streptococcus sp. CSL10205-OR2]